MRRFLSALLALVLTLLLPLAAAAQTPAGPNWRLRWEYIIGTGTAIGSYSFLTKVDTAALEPAVAVSCTPAPAAPTYTCVANLPAMTPGVHSLRVVARFTANGTSFDSAGDPANDTIAVNLIVVAGPRGLTVISQAP